MQCFNLGHRQTHTVMRERLVFTHAPSCYSESCLLRRSETVTHIYIVCDGGQDYKQYSLSDRYWQKHEGGMRRIDGEFRLISTNAQLISNDYCCSKSQWQLAFKGYKC